MELLDKRVLSKKLGVPAVGVVVGYFLGSYLAGKQPNGRYERWDSLYPGWRDGLVAVVLFDEVLPAMTREEWGRLVVPAAPYEDCPRTNIYAYPVADLELFD